VFPEREADIDSAICGRTEELTTMTCLSIHVRFYVVRKDLFLKFLSQQLVRFVCHCLQDSGFIYVFYY